MATTIEQQVTLDEALESTLQVVYDVLRRSPFFKAFLVTADVPEIYIQEFWATAKVHQHSIRFKIDTKKHIVDLEAFREMLHISPRVPGQSFAELPFEEEILEFLRFLRHSAQIKTLTDVNVNKLFQPWRSFAVVINKCLTGKSFGIDSLRRVPERKKGGSASSTAPSAPIATPTPTTTVVAAPRLSAAAKGVPDVPYDDSDEEISWNSSDDEDVDAQGKDKDDDEGNKNDESNDGQDDDDDDQDEAKKVKKDDNEGEKTDESDDDDDQDKAEKVNDDDDDEEEISKINEQKATESGEGDDEETESDGEDDGNGEKDQGLRISEEERMHEEEEADELYHDIDINQGRGLQVSQDIDDSHVTLTPVHFDGQQESSSTSSFVTSLLNQIVDLGMESIFTTGSSSVTPIPLPKSTMTPSIITTTTTASQPPIPPTPIPTDLSEMELKKILIDKMEGNKSIQRSDEQQNHVRMMMIRKDPPLDQTGGLRDEEKVGTMRQPALHLNQLPRVQAGLLQGLNLDRCLAVSLLLQRNLCRLPVRWMNPHIRCLKQVQKINPCNSLTELEYHLEEVYKATMDQLDWDNPEGQQYPHNLLQPLPLIPNNRGRHVFRLHISSTTTLSIFGERRVKDLQLGVESYQKRLNLTKPDTYRSDLKRQEAYTAYSQRKGDKDRAAAMIQAIDKMLKTRRIMRSLESEFPNKDMKEEFLGWFGKQIHQHHVDNDPCVNKSSELFALACGPSQTPISVNSCVVNGVRFVVHSRDELRTTQNSGICSPGLDGEMYYGQLKQILEFSYLSFKTVLFRVKWFNTSNKGHMARRPPGWKVVEHVSHKKFLNGGVIMVEDDPDVIHVDNSSDLALSTSLNDLEIAALHIDGQSIDVDAPPDIIDVVDEDDDIIDEEDTIPHYLADSDDEDLVNLDIDDGVNMSTDVPQGHGGDDGGDDRPSPYQVPTGCGGCLGNRGKGTRKPNLGSRRAGRLHTRQETQNLGLKAITDKSGPVLIRELVRELPLHYPSWRQMPPERKAGFGTNLAHPVGTDLVHPVGTDLGCATLTDLDTSLETDLGAENRALCLKMTCMTPGGVEWNSLPSDIYSLVSKHKVAKDLWERIQMLMQGTSLIKKERECKLYDAFDNFAYQKGETLRDFYLRFSLLLNDMNMYNMKILAAIFPAYFSRATCRPGKSKVTAIEESKDLISLSLDELIGNLKVHEIIIKKDSEIVKAKVERKFIDVKDKKKSSDEECLTFGSEDEEYAMAVRDFKKFFKKKSDEEDDEKVKDETCLVTHASSEICLGVILEHDEWIKDSGCSKHMTGNQKLFSTYKAYNGGNIIFGSNLRGNIIGKGQICDNKCRVTLLGTVIDDK
nr:hypothetical protein [Tanacetum cinerariifolium]